MRTLQIILKIILSAFQIVKELDLTFCLKKETIFKDSFVRTLKDGGAMRDRTADLLRARQALSQLSYSPIKVSILYANSLKGIGGSEWTRTTDLSLIRRTL